MLITRQLGYEGPTGTLFENVDLSLDSSAKKRVAIVGKNGCGKSTLIKLLKSELEPTSGSVSCSHEVIAHLPQDIVFPDDLQTVGAYLTSKLEEEWMSYKIDMVYEELGLPPEIAETPLEKLSGGQRVRIGLAELLLQDPTILLLDEPTNHLDKESIEWLKGFVRSFNGTVAFVSHDRNFINAVADQIWEITSRHTIEIYSCKYDEFLVERYKRYEKMLAAHEFSQREVTELEEWLAENANHPKYKFTATVAQKKKALERMEKKAPPEPVPDPRVRMRDLAPAQAGTVLNLKIERKKFGEKVLLEGVELKIASGERVLLQGPNGSGKTTLLQILAGEDKDFLGTRQAREGVKVGYLKQFSQLNPDATVLEEFGRWTVFDHTHTRNILAGYLFPTELIDEKIKKLSYGQQRRLEFAILLTNKPDLLLLDEPTNHLDIFLREDLERFLLDQDVAMVIISHDAYFVSKIGITRTLTLQ
jgi:ATPase subunit of ABC transporter with duplicated ATPase domains